jgi:hypothetical protein
MKQKDLVFVVLAVVILLVAGYLAYTQLMPKSSASSKVVTVEKIGKISSQLDAAGLARINDTQKVVNFNSVADYSSLGNTAPFGQ